MEHLLLFVTFLSPPELDARLREDKAHLACSHGVSRANACHTEGLRCVLGEQRKEVIEGESGSRRSILFPPRVFANTFLSSSELQFGFVSPMPCRLHTLSVLVMVLDCLYKALRLHLL